MKLLSSVEKYKNSLFSVTEDHAVDPDGFEIKRAIVHHNGSAVMMAVDDRQRILLVRQYRLPAQDSIWELPAGSLDAGEAALDGAKRELKEETGCRAETWTELVTFYPSPGFLAEKMTIFLAEKLTQEAATPMEDERIECRWFAPEELDQWIRDGKIIDGKTILGFLLWEKSHNQTARAARRRDG